VRGRGIDLSDVGGYDGEAEREATRLGSTVGGVYTSLEYTVSACCGTARCVQKMYPIGWWRWRSAGIGGQWPDAEAPRDAERA